MNHLRRIISLLLVLVLCFGLIPGVSAAEVDTPGTDTQTEATEAAETVPTSTEDTQPTEEPPPETESEPEESDAPADVPMDEPGLRAPGGPLTCGTQSAYNRVANAGFLLSWLFPDILGIFMPFDWYFPT